MTDYDETRKRRNTHAPIIRKASPKYWDCKCVKCGMNYMLDTAPYNIPNAMSADGFICKNCRPSAPKYAPSPPPKDVQMTIAEAFGAKK